MSELNSDIEVPVETFPVTIYGASDDLFELDSPNREIYEEYDHYNESGWYRAKLTAPDVTFLIVRANYGAGNGESDWAVEVEGENTTGWLVEEGLRPDHEFDPAIIVHVPLGTVAEELVD
jgi:hypothetical protein